jgi:hypothetical protein
MKLHEIKKIPIGIAEVETKTKDSVNVLIIIITKHLKNFSLMLIECKQTFMDVFNDEFKS